MKQLLILLMILGGMFLMAKIQAKPEQMEVTKVAVGDHLNMRTGSNASYSITSRLPYNAKGIQVLRWAEEYTGSSLWVKVAWQGRQGWVNSHYLRAYNKPSIHQKLFSCIGTEPFWNMNIYANKVDVNTLDGVKFTVPVVFHGKAMNSPAGTVIINAASAQRSVVVMTEKQHCNDGMSESNYRYKARVLMDGNSAYSGCCH
ncbi:MAG: hypothetical protein KAH03_03730 [Cocleimonas sp.]|nr:hypothetical protein [Cocleimonas sp.]